MEIVLNENISEADMNLIVSNIILSQKTEFTYEDIIKQVASTLHKEKKDIMPCVKSNIIRLRDDNMIRIFVNKYKVLI